MTAAVMADVKPETNAGDVIWAMTVDVVTQEAEAEMSVRLKATVDAGANSAVKPAVKPDLNKGLLCLIKMQGADVKTSKTVDVSVNASRKFSAGNRKIKI